MFYRHCSMHLSSSRFYPNWITQADASLLDFMFCSSRLLSSFRVSSTHNTLSMYREAILQTWRTPSCASRLLQFLARNANPLCRKLVYADVCERDFTPSSVEDVTFASGSLAGQNDSAERYRFGTFFSPTPSRVFACNPLRCW